MNLIKICILLASFLSITANAFEKQKLIFSSDSGKKPDVAFEFVGRILEQPLDLLEKGMVKDQELRKFQEFFKKLYDVNKNGTKIDVLSIWNSDERKDVEKGIDPKSEEENKARFQALTGMRLKMIVEYSDFYICYVDMTFEGENSFVMKFPIIKSGKDMYLTNKLNGDYFYDNISHLLDKSHYQFKMQ